MWSNAGKRVFRQRLTEFWGDALKLHQAIQGASFGGVGPGVSPKTALAVGLKVDAEAHPRKLRDQLKSGQVNFEDSATTLALLELNAVVGITGFFDDGGSLRSVGIQCAEIDLYAEDLPSGERSLCTTGQFILVAVRDDGHPVPTSRAEALGEGFSNGGNER